MKKETLEKAFALDKQEKEMTDLVNSIMGVYKNTKITSHDGKYDSVVMVNNSGVLSMQGTLPVKISDKAKESLKMIGEFYHSQISIILQSELDRIKKEFETLQDSPELPDDYDTFEKE